MNVTRTSGVVPDWWLIPLGLLATIAVVWVLLVAALWLVKPANVGVEDYLRLMPDLIRLLKGVATDRQIPRGTRIAIFGLLAFIASPIDLIPDVIPVIGVADDVVLIALVLRWVVRRTGEAALARHWRGTADGLAAVRRLFGAPDAT